MWEINIWELIKTGGPIMFPIIICSVVALAIVFSKLFYFSSIRTNVPQLKIKIYDLLKSNKIKEAIAFCESNASPMAKILKAGILKYGHTREEIKEAMEDVSLFEIPQLEKRLSALATIAHVSPLLGLLGTVTGMTSSFHTIKIRAASMNPVTPGDLAGGIGEALFTTVAGLMVAIPTFIAYNFLISQVNSYVIEMERTATELVNFLFNLSESGAISVQESTS